MEEETTVQTEEQERKLPYGEWFYWLQTMIAAIVCIVVVFTLFGRIIRVVGSSMDNTLAEGELMLVWSLGYRPQTGDIVVCNKTTRESVDLLHGDAIIKRVVAVGGQTVDIDYGSSTVFVDGQPLDEPYLPEEMYWPDNPEMMETRFQVPEGCVFLMGDNRNHSTDSRHQRLGCVDEGYLLGKAVFVLFPFSRFGTL